MGMVACPLHFTCLDIYSTIHFLFVAAMVKSNPPPDSHASSLLPNSWMCPLVTKNKGVPPPPSVNWTVDQSLPSDEVKHVFGANSME